MPTTAVSPHSHSFLIGPVTQVPSAACSKPASCWSLSSAPGHTGLWLRSQSQSQCGDKGRLPVGVAGGWRQHPRYWGGPGTSKPEKFTEVKLGRKLCLGQKNRPVGKAHTGKSPQNNSSLVVTVQGTGKGRRGWEGPGGAGPRPFPKHVCTFPPSSCSVAQALAEDLGFL